MKKFSLILVVGIILLVSVISASAAEKTKADYYVEISSILANIQKSLDKGDLKAAKDGCQMLRACVYRCAKFLVDIKAYKSEIMNIITVAEDALTHDNYRAYIGEAKDLAKAILLDDPAAEHNGDQGGDDGNSVNGIIWIHHS